MKSLVVLATLFLYSYAQAQHGPDKGILGGTVHYLNKQIFLDDPGGNKFDNYSVYEVSLNPYVGYRLSEHWIAGVQGGIFFHRFSSSGNSVNPTYRRNYVTYSAGLFARRYFRTDKPVQFFLEPGLSYTGYKYDSSNPQILAPYTTSYREGSALVSPGITWSVSKRFNLLARFGKLHYVSGRRREVFTTQDVAYNYLNLRLNSETLFIGAELKL